MPAMFGTLVIAAALLGPAQDAGNAAAVRWSAPPQCPAQAQVVGRVEALLGDAGSGHREPVTLSIVVEPAEAGWSMALTMVGREGAQGQRTLTAERCEDLASAAVVIAALAIDPELVMDEDATSPDPQPALPQVPVVAPPHDDQTQASQPAPPASQRRPIQPRTEPPHPLPTQPIRSRESVAGVVLASLGVGLGRLAPAPSGLARIGAGVEVGSFRGLVRVSGLGPSIGTATGASDVGGTFGAATVGLAACGRLPRATRWSLVGCLASDIGVAGGRGRNTVNTGSARSVWWGIEAELGAEVRVAPRWALALRVDGGAVPGSPRFVVDAQGRACCVRWGAGVRLGALARFGAGVGRIASKRPLRVRRHSVERVTARADIHQ